MKKSSLRSPNNFFWNESQKIPLPISLSTPQRFAPATFRFNYSANSGLTYAVQRSADWRNWIGISTSSATGNPAVFVDNNATNGLSFYRVQRVLNP